VFWVHSSNATRFEQSFRDIADCVRIPGRQNATANIFKLVQDWLRGSKWQWLLILDNVDDAGFLLDTPSGGAGSSSKTLREYLPQCQNESILITTRSEEAALKLVEPCDVIAVDPMDQAHALTLFEKKLGVQEGRGEIAELAAALEFMPLAIVQAAAYISARAPRCSVQQYLEQFRKNDHKKTSLLDHEGGRLRRDREAKNSIIITWQISFDHIHQTRPSAAGLLSLVSFFDRQGIPEALLKSRSEQQEDAQTDQEEHGGSALNDEEDRSSQSSQNEDFENDIVTLRNFSFISINADRITFEMHRLVQLATRKWLEAHGELEKWKQQFIRNLCEEFPTGEYETWVRCQALFPHVKSAADQQPEDSSSLTDWATLLYYAARYSWKMGNFSDAEDLALISIKARTKLFGKEHEDTLNSMEILGIAYDIGGKWETAAEIQLKVMETRKKKLGADHPDTLTSMANLASTLWNQGRWDAAEELEVQVMETSKKKLGADHPDTLTSMANLAATYRNQGRLKEAEELQTEELELCKAKLGADHPDTLISMANLALIWKEQSRDTEATGLMRECVQLRERKLGTNHPHFMSSSNTLATWEAEQAEARTAT
jgi:tetratricopeptide (TPR) repeat protein